MTPEPSIRAGYQAHGVPGFYEEHGAAYHNPHEQAVRAALAAGVEHWPLNLGHVLDLACGSGEATLALRGLGAGSIDGIDPYTGAAYLARTGQAAEACSFEQIAAGALDGRRYGLIVCSYALHLAEPSRLPQLAWQLSRLAPALLLLTPHKRPVLRPEWGWHMAGELRVQRVRARLYQASAA
jgi:2-polyprenyl-3-methyl-5-hydroxy-6-metoxy-1,4-benzoquinol methylase